MIQISLIIKIITEIVSKKYNKEITTLLIKQAVSEGECSGADAHHLAFDVSAAKWIFDGLDAEYPVESRFLMTDGGLTMFSPQT